MSNDILTTAINIAFTLATVFVHCMYVANKINCQDSCTIVYNCVTSTEFIH